jgi:nucleotide-binding universal stress UspA family protein
MLKHILSPVTGEKDGEHVPLCAQHIAQRFSAHVTAAFAEPPDFAYAPVIGLGVTATFYENFYAQQLKAWDDLRHSARGHFDAAVAQTKMPIASRPLCAQATTEWLDGVTGDGNPVWACGLLADLVVLNIPGERGERSLVEEVLFGARRPVLLVPPGQTDVLFTAPLVAWNGGPEAANAVRASLDLFTPASKITVLQVGDPRPGAIAAERMADGLGWHCFDASVRAVPDAPHRTGAIILEEARALGSTVIVIGAYGHSRTREFILGGVTEYLLQHSTVPLLLAH